MVRKDARKMSPDEVKALRMKVVQMRRDGLSNKEIARRVGLPPQTTSEYYSRYRKEGDAFFTVRKAGRRRGSGQKLGRDEQKKILRLIMDQSPRSHHSPYSLWTREAVRQLIENEMDKQMPMSTVGDYLRRWGITSEKPLNSYVYEQAYDRKNPPFRKWVENELSRIEEQASDEGAHLWWMKIASLDSSDDGATKNDGLDDILRNLRVVRITTNVGKRLFGLYGREFGTRELTELFDGIIDSSDKKIFLIVSNLQTEHSSHVVKWLDEHRSALELFTLPAFHTIRNEKIR
jgi:transposase